MELNFSWVIEGELAGHRAPSSEQDIKWLREQGILSLVRMVETDRSKVDSMQIERLGLTDCHEPVVDFTAPKQYQIDKMIDFIVDSIAERRPVGVSCGEGLGRTGTILACYFVKSCINSEEAINLIRDKRPGSIEAESQEEAIRNYAKSLAKHSGT